MYKYIMDQICIAKKVTEGNVEFLDFALDNNDNLLVFDTFEQASIFLKQNVGTGSEILDYILSTVNSQKDKPRMIEILRASQARQSAPMYNSPQMGAPAPQMGVQAPQMSAPAPQPSQAPGIPLIQDQISAFQQNQVGEVQCSFLLDCTRYQVMGNQVIIDLNTNRQVFPALAFVDVNNPTELTHMPNFKVKSYFIIDTKDINNK